VTADRTVLVPTPRLARWFENFATRHGPFRLATHDGRLVAAAEDGAVATATLPFDRRYAGPPDVATFAHAASSPVRWGLLLVRKGGFAVAAGTTERPDLSKVGRRHVQGRTKAGGQSQQRFARRRDNQARQAFEAAADHAHRLLVAGSAAPDVLVCGGDRSAVEEVLGDPRLREVAAARAELWLPVAEPKRAVLDQAIADAWSATVRVTEP
jgi:hypothetical protein